MMYICITCLSPCCLSVWKKYDTILDRIENDRNTTRHTCKSVSKLNSKTIERESEHKKHRNATN